MSEPAASSYTQILKSSSLIGGAQGINLLLGMVRTKFAAVLIGSVGVGLVGNYGAIQGLVGTVAGLGIQSSGVREVAEAVGRGDQEAIGRTVLTLRRICWLTGAIGALAMVALGGLLSRWTFGNDAHALEVAALGLVILLGNISGGQTTLIQGMRRIGDLAMLTIVGALASTRLVLPTVPEWADPVWHLYVIRNQQRDALQHHLTEAGVGSLIHYPIPPHLQQAYASLGYKPGDFPIAEAMANEVLSLPMGPQLSTEQHGKVTAALLDFKP